MQQQQQQRRRRRRRRQLCARLTFGVAGPACEIISKRDYSSDGQCCWLRAAAAHGDDNDDDDDDDDDNDAPRDHTRAQPRSIHHARTCAPHASSPNSCGTEAMTNLTNPSSSEKNKKRANKQGARGDEREEMSE